MKPIVADTLLEQEFLSIVGFMLNILRRTFPDRLMDHDDLDAVAALLRSWYPNHRPVRSIESKQYLELHLWGFARDRSETLAQLLKMGLASYNLPESYVSLVDPDTIVVSCPPVPLTELLPRGLWLDLFAGEEFAGLPIMLRLSISEFPAESELNPELCTTLVLVGELQKGQLLLKAVWPNARQTSQLEQLYHKAVWPGEKTFLQALDSYRKTGRVGTPTVNLFVSQSQVQLGNWVLRLLFDLPGQSKVPAFLGRLGFFLLLIVVSGLTLFNTRLGLLGFRPLAFLGLIGLSGFGLNLWRKARHIYLYRSKMKAALHKLYSQPVRYPEVDLKELGVAENPVHTKYTAELEALGARHLVDVQIEPVLNSRSYLRFFQLPEDRTYIILNVMRGTESFRFFPPQPFLISTTYFSDGSRLVSTNAKQTGFQKPRKTNIVVCSFAQSQAPADFIANHQRVLKRLLEEGRRLAPLMTAQGALDAQIRETEETAVLAKKQGYCTWGTAIRQSFGLVRKEYLQHS